MCFKTKLFILVTILKRKYLQTNKLSSETNKLKFQNTQLFHFYLFLLTLNILPYFCNCVLLSYILNSFKLSTKPNEHIIQNMTIWGRVDYL